MGKGGDGPGKEGEGTPRIREKTGLVGRGKGEDRLGREGEVRQGKGEDRLDREGKGSQ